MLGKQRFATQIRIEGDTFWSDDVQGKSNTELLEVIKAIIAMGLGMDTDALESHLSTLQERASQKMKTVLLGILGQTKWILVLKALKRL